MSDPESAGMTTPVPGTRRARILVVDDIEANLVAMEAVLSDVAAELVRARSGEEALRCLLDQDFAVILLDVQMPHMDGFEAAELIRQRPRSRHTPIVFVTAISKTGEHVRRGYSLGAVDYVFKPILPEVLRAKVQVFVDLFDLRERERAIAEALARKTAELERSNADLAQFAHVAAHDLQEPLRTITSYLRLLSRRYRGKLDRDADEFIDFAVNGSLRMQALIQDLLAFARLGAGRGAREPVDLDQAFARARAALAQALADSGATVEASGLPTVVGDPSQLARLLQNLLSNALKFRQADVRPHVVVTADRLEREWLIRFQDNGVGIAPEDRERVFGLFERLHARDDRSGTGLGLAICRRIVEGHGGRIWVEATPGGGATFSFVLPASGESVAGA